jgi:hypothetical protein
LPVRAQYAPNGWQIGLNYLDDSPEELWYTLADLIAGVLLGGPQPQILEAFRVVSVGIQRGLHPIRFRGVVEVDPRDESFFVQLVEERHKVKKTSGLDAVERASLEGFLKTDANAVSYGIWAEMRDEPARARGATVEVAGLSRFQTRIHRPERAGEYCFPPLAASVTGLARLLLALIEAEVEAKGGTYLACDTDSLIVVASERGGRVQIAGGKEVMALTWADIEEIRERLNRLNPYDRQLVPELVKLEDDNFALRSDGSVDRTKRVKLFGLAISAKRFALYESDP